jgi:hypothetical protein
MFFLSKMYSDPGRSFTRRGLFGVCGPPVEKHWPVGSTVWKGGGTCELICGSDVAPSGTGNRDYLQNFLCNSI